MGMVSKLNPVHHITKMVGIFGSSPLPKKRPEPFSVHLDACQKQMGDDQVYGNVQWQTLISQDITPTDQLVLGVAHFPANGQLRPHRHAPAEFYFGLTVDGVVMIDNAPHTITAGTAVYVPSNAEHGVVAGEDGLSFAYGFPYGAFSDVEYQFSKSADRAI